MLAPGTRLKDRYCILEQIGGGGFGHVYKAIDENFGFCVAIKETKDEVDNIDTRKAFEREAKLLRSLKHDCLPRVTDYFSNQAQFLVMDFIDGEDLAALLKKKLPAKGPFTFDEVMPWAERVLDALHYLHSHPEPIIHRDLKPSNLRLSSSGEIYLLDFGLAKGAAGQMSTIKDGDSSFSLAAFSHNYAPLEQIQGTGTYPQSDIYAFGATFYHLLTGELPVKASERDEAWQKGQGDPLRPAYEVNRAVPIGISHILWRAMSIRWWDRFVSVREMHEALTRASINDLTTNPVTTPKNPSLPLLWPALDFTPEIESWSLDFIGRTWLVSELEEWLVNEERRVTVIVGKHGIGKSAIAAWLTRTRPEVLGVHFCTEAKPRSLNPLGFVHSLVAQLQEHLQGFSDVLQKQHPQIRRQTASDAFRDLIVEPMWRVPVSQPRLLIIDSLDTAITQMGETILDVLIKHAQYLPAWLRIIATTKPDPQILDRINQFRLFHLDGLQNVNRADVRQYLSLRIQTPSFVKRAGRVDEKIQDRLNELVAGNFQCAKVVLAHLENGTLPFADLNRLSPGLVRVYSYLFEWRFRDLEQYRRVYEPILQVLVAAREPLPLSLLLQAGEENVGVNDARVEELQAYLDSSSDQEIELRRLHTTVTDWLTNANESGAFFIDPAKGHERLAAIGWSEFKKSVAEMSAYSLAHLPMHLGKLGRWGDLLTLISCRELGLLSLWTDKGETDVGLFCLEGIVEYLESKKQTVEAAGFATQIAQIETQRGSYNKAAHWLEYALHHTSYFRGRKERAIAFHELGSLFLYQAKYQQAETAYRKAFRLCTYSVPRYRNEAAANLVALATVSLETFHLKKAIRCARRAIHKAQLGKDLKHLLAGLRVTAAAYRRLGSYDQANVNIEGALATSEEAGQPLEKVRILLLRGWVQFDQAILRNEPPLVATANFLESLAEAERIQNYFGIMEAEFGLGWCALGGNVSEVAADRLQRVGSLLPSQAYLGPRVGYLVGVAKLMRLDEDLDAALSKCEEALARCRQYQILNWEAWALVELGSIYWERSQHAQAEATWRAALVAGSRISPAFQTLVQMSINSYLDSARR